MTAAPPFARVRAILLAALLIGVSCADPGGPGRNGLEFWLRDHVLAVADTMTVRLTLDGQDAPASWKMRQEGPLLMTASVAPFHRVSLTARDTGDVWLVVEGTSFLDSTLISAELLPVATAGFTFYDDADVINGTNKTYHPVGGMCFSFTTETFKEQTGRDYWKWQLGAFVVDGFRNPRSRGPTTWSYSNPPVLEITTVADSVNDVYMRPASEGHSTMEMSIPPYKGRIDIFVDPTNECRGIVPSLARAIIATATPLPVYVW